MLYEGFEVLGRALFCLKLGYTALILGFCVALDLIDLLIYYACVCVYANCRFLFLLFGLL